jgi:hypothetical protein
VTCPKPPLPRTLSLTQFATSNGSSAAIVKALNKKENKMIHKNHHYHDGFKYVLAS